MNTLPPTSSSQSTLGSVSAGTAKTAPAPLLLLSHLNPLTLGFKWVPSGPVRPTPPVRGRWPKARGGRDHRTLQSCNDEPNRAPNKTYGFVGERTSSGVNEPWHLCRGERYEACEDDVGAACGRPRAGGDTGPYAELRTIRNVGADVLIRPCFGAPGRRALRTKIERFVGQGLCPCRPLNTSDPRSPRYPP